MSIFCLKNEFFDIVFDVEINNSTYSNNEYIDGHLISKNFWKLFFIILNGFILLSFIYALIFIIIPAICFKLGKCSKKSTRISEFKGKIGENSISLLKERFTSDA